MDTNNLSDKDFWSVLQKIKRAVSSHPSNYPVLPDERPLYEIQLDSIEDFRHFSFLHHKKTVFIERPEDKGFGLSRKFPFVIIFSLGEDFDKLYDQYAVRFKDNSTTTETNIEIRIEKEGTKIFLLTPDNRLLIHAFSTDSPLEEMFNYIYTHPGQEVSVGSTHFATSGYSKERNLAEDIRSAGFNSSLKQYFFPVCTKKLVVFKNPATITNQKLTKLLTELKTDF